MGPDDLKVELVETPQQAAPIALHHVHFLGQQNNEMHAWYVKIFGAEARPATNFPSAVLPGVSLLFSPSTDSRPRNAGARARSHRLRGAQPRSVRDETDGERHQAHVEYRKVPALNTAVAFFTDPGERTSS